MGQTMDAVDFLRTEAQFSGHNLENAQFNDSGSAYLQWELVREQVATCLGELQMVCSEIRRIRKSEGEFLAALKEEAMQRGELARHFEDSMISVCEQVYLSHATTNEFRHRLASVENIIYELGLSATTSNRVEDLSSEVEALSTNVGVLQSRIAKDCSAWRDQFVDLIRKYEADANNSVVAINELRQGVQNMASYFLAEKSAFKLDNSELGMRGAFDISQFSQLQGTSEFFRQHGGDFIEDNHDETGLKFLAVQSTEENSFGKQYVQPAGSLAKCRQEHDDVSAFSSENTKKNANEKIEGEGVVCDEEIDPQHESLCKGGGDKTQGGLLVFHCTHRERDSPTRRWWQSHNSVNEAGVYHGKHSAVVGCFLGIIARLR